MRSGETARVRAKNRVLKDALKVSRLPAPQKPRARDSKRKGMQG